MNEQALGVNSFNYSNTWGISSEGNVYRMGGSTCSFLAEKCIVNMTYDADIKEFTLICEEKNINLQCTVYGKKIFPYFYLWQVGNKLTLKI